MAASRLRRRRVLVTGATGFVGRHAIAALVSRGHIVHATYTEPSAPRIENVTWHRADLLKCGDAARAVRAACPEALLHLAWYAKHGAFWTATENLAWVRASIDLVEAFVASGGKRVVVAGSCAEYEWGGDERFDERRTPCAPSTLYGVSKDALHRILEAYSQRASISLAWGRLFFLYGPGEHPERFVTYVAKTLLSGHHANCTHGRQVRDFMHVEDAGRAFGALLDSCVEGPVNIASGHAVALRDVAMTIERIVGSRDALKLGAIPARRDDARFLVARVSRLRKEVRFKPRWTLAQGLRNTVDALR